MNELMHMTLLYETNKNTLSKIKDMYSKSQYAYFAGSLIIKSPDLVNAESYVSIDVIPINTIPDSIEQEIVYYASKMYKKFKGPKCSFYKQAIENIAEYKRNK